MRIGQGSGAAVAFLLLGSTLGCASPNPLVPHLRGSVGLPHHGVLTEGAKLPAKGDGFVRLRKDPIAWGVPALVRTLERSAAAVRKDHGTSTLLVIGDLSAERGGKIPRHRSHRTGRDVDLLFYATTPRGVPIRSPGFVKYHSDGLGQDDDGKLRRFDVARNWALVKALLSDEETPVQWVFVSRSLEVLLVEHALAKGEPLELVWRAETVMKQPGDSAPHDDHFHVRLSCTPLGLQTGCAGGPSWEWDKDPEPVEVATPQLIRELLEGL